jgi:predicted  nucleic acid-binding Zn-ribbon protein
MSEDFITLTAEDQRRSNPRAAMVRAEVRSAKGYANQRAHDLRIGPQPNYVDGSRSDLNRILINPPTAPQLRELVEDRRAQRETSRKLKSNAGIAVIGVIGFGIDAAKLFAELTPQAQDKALLEAAQIIANEANTTLEGLVYHLDETSGHAHVTWCGYDLDGEPLSSTMKRGMLSRFQDRLAEVMAKHCPGIERGKLKSQRIEAGAELSETLHRSVRELHEDLPKEIAAKQAELNNLLTQIPELTARVEEMQARVDKLEDEEKQRELTAAKVKRLRTYRSRLVTRIADLRDTREEKTRLAKEIAEQERLLSKLRDQVAAEQEKARSATESLQKARKELQAVTDQKNTEERLVAALGARKGILDADVRKLESEREEARSATERLQEARKELQAVTDQKTAEEHSVAALEARRDILGADVKQLTNAKENILSKTRELNRHKKALDAEVAGMQEGLELLRPALRAADALREMSKLDAEEQQAAWDMICTPNVECNAMEQAAAIRMIDPLFAPQVPVPRSRWVNENLQTLQECSDGDYVSVLGAVSAEEGAEAGVEAIRLGTITLQPTGEVASFQPSGVLSEAFGWAKRAFEGVKRGVGLALAATRGALSAERTAANASLFMALEPQVQSALRRVLKAEGAAEDPNQGGGPDQDNDPGDDFSP